MKFSKLTKYKGLIFDLDGTLIDSMPFHARAWKQVANEHGFDIDMADIYRLGGSSSYDIARFYKNQGFPVGDIKTYVDRKIEIYLENVPNIIVFEELFNFLKESRKNNVKIAIGTGSRTANVESLLQAKNMTDFIDVVVTSDNVTRHKPNPDTFLLAAERMKLSPKECCVFEDGGLGLKAAVAGGFDCVEVKDGRMMNLYEIDRS